MAHKNLFLLHEPWTRKHISPPLKKWIHFFFDQSLINPKFHGNLVASFCVIKQTPWRQIGECTSNMMQYGYVWIARSVSAAAEKCENLFLQLSECVYQSWHFLSLPQGPLPTNLVHFLLRPRFRFCWPLCAFTNLFTYVRTYLLTIFP